MLCVHVGQPRAKCCRLLPLETGFFHMKYLGFFAGGFIRMQKFPYAGCIHEPRSCTALTVTCRPVSIPKMRIKAQATQTLVPVLTNSTSTTCRGNCLSDV